MSEPWERQKAKRETSKAFRAFTVYRDLGPKRSVAEANKLYSSNGKPTANLRQMEEWSSKYGWVSRAMAWDDEQDRVKREKQLDAIREMAERHAKLSLRFIEKIGERMQTILPDELSPADLKSWFETAVKIERLSRGEPDSITQQRHEGEVNVRHLTDEQLHERIREFETFLRPTPDGERSA
jgi:hypothetical protein